MTEVIRFPSIQKLLVAELRARLDVPVVTRVPKERPSSFVRLVRVGGNRRNIITDRAMVTVECWGADIGTADDLCELTRAHIFALAPDVVRRVKEIAGPQDFPDPLSEHPRYQFTVQIDTRGAAL